MTSPAPTYEAATTASAALGSNEQAPKSPSLNVSKIAPVFPYLVESRVLWAEFLLASFAFVNLAIFNLLLQFDFFASVGDKLNRTFAVVFAVLSLPVAAYCLYGAARRVGESIERRFLTPDICHFVAIGLMAALAFHSILFDRETLYQLSWDQNLIVVLFLLASARLVHAYLFTPLRGASGFELSDLSPTARRLSIAAQETTTTNGAGAMSSEIVPVSQIRINELIQVSAGEYVPFDGVIVDGNAQVAEVRLSGRSEFKHKLQGDQVFAGSRIVSGRLVLRVMVNQSEAHITAFSGLLNERLSATLGNNLERINFAITLAVFAILAVAAGAAFVWMARGATFAQVTSIFAALSLSTVLCQLIGLNTLLKPIAETSAFRAGALSSSDYLVDKLSKLKALILDYRPGSTHWQGEVSKIEVIDRRIDENSLLAAIFALSDRAYAPKYQTISQYLRSRYPRLQLLAVKDFHEFSATGLFAAIEGYEISLGDENFMLERGVMMQPSELGTSSVDEEVLYVALNAEIIARVVLAPKLSTAANEAVTQLKSLGIRTVLCSMEPGEDLDSIGKRMGLELSNVYGGLNRETFGRKIEALSPVAVLMNDSTERDAVQGAAATISVFDELHWDIKRSDVVLFSHSPSVWSQSFSLAKNFSQVKTQNLIFGVGLTLVLVVLGALGFITPAISCAAVFTAGLALLLNSYRLAASSFS